MKKKREIDTVIIKKKKTIAVYRQSDTYEQNGISYFFLFFYSVAQIERNTEHIYTSNIRYWINRKRKKTMSTQICEVQINNDTNIVRYVTKILCRLVTKPRRCPKPVVVRPKYVCIRIGCDLLNFYTRDGEKTDLCIFKSRIFRIFTAGRRLDPKLNSFQCVFHGRSR